MESTIVLAVLLVLLIPAVVFDIRHKKIPNWLVFPFWLLAPILHLALSGLPALGFSLAGLGFAFVVALPFWLVKWMGAGDVKLIAANGALLGWPLALPMLLAIGLSGAVLAILVLLVKGALLRTVERYNAAFTISLAQKKLTYIEAQGEDARIQLPYAVAIALGTLVVYLNDINIINIW